MLEQEEKDYTRDNNSNERESRLMNNAMTGQIY